MDKRIIAAKIESLQTKIDIKRDYAARIRDRLTDPIRASIGMDHVSSYDPRKREIMLTESIDKAAQLEKEAAELQRELDQLREELREELRECEYRTRCVIRSRLIYGCSWQEVAELAGYSEGYCQRVFETWIAS